MKKLLVALLLLTTACASLEKAPPAEIANHIHRPPPFAFIWAALLGFAGDGLRRSRRPVPAVAGNPAPLPRT